MEYEKLLKINTKMDYCHSQLRTVNEDQINRWPLPLTNYCQYFRIFQFLIIG
jgi:hypothetical protein